MKQVACSGSSHNVSPVADSNKLLIAALLAVGLILAPYGSGSGHTVHANGVPYWDLEQNGVRVTTLQVAVGGMFTVDVWIRGILSSDGLTDLYPVVTWDPTMMALDSHEEASNTHNWERWHVEYISVDTIDFSAVCGYAGCPPQSVVIENVMVLSLHFQMSRSGLFTSDD